MSGLTFQRFPVGTAWPQLGNLLPGSKEYFSGKILTYKMRKKRGKKERTRKPLAVPVGYEYNRTLFSSSSAPSLLASVNQKDHVRNRWGLITQQHVYSCVSAQARLVGVEVGIPTQ